MQVKLRALSVLSLPTDFLTLEEINSKGFSYLLSVNINKELVKSSRAASLVVRTYRTNPKNSFSTSVLSSTDNNSSVSGLSGVSSTSLVRSIQSRAIATSTKISQTRNDYLTTDSYGIQDLITKFGTGISYIKEGTNFSSGVKNSVFASTGESAGVRLEADTTIPQLCLEAISNQKQDPASLVSQRVWARPTALQTNNGTPSQFSRPINPVASSLVASPTVSQPPTNPTVLARSKSELTVVEIELPLFFYETAIGTDDFFLLVSLLDGNGVLIQEEVGFVKHKTNQAILTRVQVPPSFQINRRQDGLLVASVKQMDRYATTVTLFKTEMDNTPRQEVVSVVSVPFPEERTIIIPDTSQSTTLYRAVAYNDLGIGGVFSGQVLEPTATSDTRFKFISLRSKITDTGLNLSISSLPENTSVVSLFREEIGKEEEVRLVDFLVAGGASTNQLTFLDTNLVPWKSYRYFCELTDTSGNIVPTNASVEIVYRPKTRDYAAVSVTTPTVTTVQLPGNNTQFFDVSFQVSYAMTKKLEDGVREFLLGQGLLEYYGSDIQRENLKDLLITKVELRDLETNDVSFLGYVDGTFVQSTTKYGLLSKPSSYQYELTTFVRTPDTLLSSVEITKQSTPRNNGADKEYSLVPFNSLHPFGLLTGTNPKKSGNEFTNLIGLQQFDFGDVTDVSYLQVELKPPSPSINNQRASVFNKKLVEVSWSINGEQEQISHFIVRRQNVVTGEMDLSGVVHGINSKNSYLFVDEVRLTETGLFRYIITPQFFKNMILGTSVQTNDVEVSV